MEIYYQGANGAINHLGDEIYHFNKNHDNLGRFAKSGASIRAKQDKYKNKIASNKEKIAKIDAERHSLKTQKRHSKLKAAQAKVNAKEAGVARAKANAMTGRRTTPIQNMKLRSYYRATKKVAKYQKQDLKWDAKVEKYNYQNSKYSEKIKKLESQYKQVSMAEIQAKRAAKVNKGKQFVGR